MYIYVLVNDNTIYNVLYSQITKRHLQMASSDAAAAAKS